MPINGVSLPGDLLVVEQLGGQVFRAQRKRDGRELAVRIVPSSARDLAAAASGIRHPALAHVEAYGVLDDSSAFIAHELVRGPTLLSWRQQNAAPELAQIVELMRTLHAALAQAARAGVLHEAINPRNVRLSGTIPKLLDLGVPAAAFDQTRDALAATFVAPEAAASCTAAMNVYACGCLLYFLVAGEPPDAALSIKAKAVPANLRAVLKRALARDPQDRFSSVAELDAALAASTRSISQRASQPDARVSDMGVEPIGLRSSSPPDLLSSYPPEADELDLAADDELAEPTQQHTPQWLSVVLALPFAAVACLALFFAGRALLAPPQPAQQGALAPQSRKESEPAAPAQGLPLTARVHIREIQVHGGSVPAALVKRSAIRLQAQFKHCYEQSARAAGYNSFGELSVNFQIDQEGRARAAQVLGANLPQLDACITQGLSSLVSEGPSDTDNMLASFKIAFTP